MLPGLDEFSLEGVPDAVEELAEHLRRTALTLRGTSDSFTVLQGSGSVWQGPTAHGFIDHVGELSRRLDQMEQELREAESSLRVWRQGCEERQTRMSQLRDEYQSAQAEPADEVGGGAQQMMDQLRVEMQQVHEEHQTEAGQLASQLSRATMALSAAASIDVSAWLAEAEARIRELDEQIDRWIGAHGEPLTDAVSTMGQTTALSSTVTHAAGAVTAGAAALTSAVVTVAASAPGSHRLMDAARKAPAALRVDELPEASFAKKRRA